MMKLLFGLHAVRALLEHQLKQPRSSAAIAEIKLVSGKLNARLSSVLNLVDRINQQNQQTQAAKPIRITRHSIKQLDQQANGERHQGVIALVHETDTAQQAHNALDIISLVKNLAHPALLLILDTVQDPHNLGACLRTANAVGVDAVLAPKDKAVGITPVVSKVACGAEQTTPFYQVTNLARTIEQLKALGVWVLGAAGEGEASVYQQDFTSPVAIVMGNEAQGLRRLTRDKCDQLFHIPMLGSVESLNVSVATGVCLYEAVRQRSCDMSMREK